MAGYRQESSAKLTNQRVSYAFTSSPFSFHARHILPTSKFQYSYSCIYLFTKDISEQYVWELWLCVWTQFTGLTLPLWGRPVNNPITLISPVQWGLHFCRWQSINFRSFLRKPERQPIGCRDGTRFEGKVTIQGNAFRCQWKATKGLHSTI